MPRRYLFVAMTFSLSVLLYVDRICISAAATAVQEDLSLTKAQMSWVFSAFTLGYALFQIPSGALADRFGPRRIITAVVCFWSLFTALTAAAWNLATMFLVRFLFGIGEAGAFPGCARAVYSWLPVAERGLAQGVNFSGSRLGGAFALPIVAAMTGYLGWRATFLCLGGVSLMWGGFWWWWFRDDPADHAGVSPEELQRIVAGRQQTPDQPGSPSRLTAASVIGSGNMWLLMGQYFASNFTFFFLLTWCFTYLKERYQLEAVQTGWYAMTPLLFGALGNWAGGAMVDALYAGGWRRLSRQLPAMIGFALAAGGIVATHFMTGIGGAVTCLSIAVFGADMTLSPSWSACIDIGRRHAGAVSGTMNMAGNLGAFVTALAFSYLKEWTGSDASFFLVAAALSVLAIGAWTLIRTDRPLEGAA